MSALPDLVMVVEDEPRIRALVADALRAANYAVHEAGTLRQALTDAANRNPALVVLDLGLPDGDGAEFVRRMRDWSAAPVLVLSARHDEAVKVAALDAGADDYLTKPFSMPELLARVRALLRRQLKARVPQASVAFGDVELDLSRQQVTRAGEPVHLTPTEYRLLVAMVAGQGRVLTHRHLLREVWGQAYAESAHYLRIYVGHLRAKLEDDPARPKHFITETGVGYRFVV
ncbi:response regulator [Niveibacterium microcysteis]|uniref:Response regulator n=1 Tax=Niveibacterium microcysteis TaxID=2811415 RepID=A0ABX7M4S5_9RHOO|nr:response regulator [Niveibacterium microcysteis]QSI75709.1 response regulator [Niveibacterium microcysteis]